MLVVAIDPPVREEKDRRIDILVRGVDEYVSGYKIGIPFLLKHGKQGIRRLRRLTEKPIIADLKLADIGDIMSTTVKHLANTGVNAVIAHAFVGYNGALETLMKTSMVTGIGIILVASMSHEGSREFIDKHIDEFLDLAVKAEVEGIVTPATRPNVIRYARERLGGSIKIYSPGIGIQGAEPGSALCAGADYEIVGRLITGSKNPGEAAREVREIQLKRWSKCHG
ncbi:MAG: orotidine-5'-phosphate decarboxylase [Desulfurococcus sp.]|uniref:orotidine-5'-phosphate decarboxylase n=1 Tax=Desulfurococcus sp. TaxID=51678 RepID=UPI0031614AE0